MKGIIAFVTLTFILVATSASAMAAGPIATGFVPLSVEGWTLQVGPDLNRPKHKKLRGHMVDTLRGHLRRITGVLKPATVQRLQKVTLWATLSSKRFPGLVYHPSAKWLAKNGFQPAMAKGIQIANAAAFVRRKDTPWSIMHELSHAYHHQVLGYADRRLKRVYAAAKASGKYLKVKRVKSKPQKHYGMNNEREFFAEMTEAYLGTNDFQPFDRAGLKRFDRATYAVIDKIWRPHLKPLVKPGSKGRAMKETPLTRPTKKAGNRGQNP